MTASRSICRHGLASFWIDVKGTEVKVAKDIDSAESDQLTVVGSVANGVE